MPLARHSLSKVIPHAVSALGRATFFPPLTISANSFRTFNRSSHTRKYSNQLRGFESRRAHYLCACRLEVRTLVLEKEKRLRHSNVLHFFRRVPSYRAHTQWMLPNGGVGLEHRRQETAQALGTLGHAPFVLRAFSRSEPTRIAGSSSSGRAPVSRPEVAGSIPVFQPPRALCTRTRVLFLATTEQLS